MENRIIFDSFNYDYEDELDYDFVGEEWRMIRRTIEEAFDAYQYCITQGTQGLWTGTHKAGHCGTIEDILDTILEHADAWDLKIEDNDLWITAYHHDGRNHYCLRRLNDEGQEFWETCDDLESPAYEWSLQRIHDELMKPEMSESLAGIF